MALDRLNLCIRGVLVRACCVTRAVRRELAP